MIVPTLDMLLTPSTGLSLKLNRLQLDNFQHKTEKKKERGFYFQVGYGKLQKCSSSYIEEKMSNNLQNYYVFRGFKITSRTELQKVRRLSEERWDRWTL